MTTHIIQAQFTTNASKRTNIDSVDKCVVNEPELLVDDTRNVSTINAQSITRSRIARPIYMTQ